MLMKKYVPYAPMWSLASKRYSNAIIENLFGQTKDNMEKECATLGEAPAKVGRFIEMQRKYTVPKIKEVNYKVPKNRCAQKKN